MTAKSAGAKPTLIPGPRSSHGYQQLVKSGELIYNGALVALDAGTGKWAEAVSTDATQIVYGFARLGDQDSFDNSAGTNTAEMLVDSECALLNFASISTTDEGKVCYVVDDQTATLTPGGPICGIIQLYSDSTHAYVMVDPLINKALALTSAGSGSTAYTARMVATTVQVYTGTGTGTLTITATGAMSSIDGVTPAVGDVIFYQEGATNLTGALDAGPWQVSVVGTTGVSPVLVRPSWWAHGGPIVPGINIQIGGEGTGTTPRYAGSTWKSFAAKSQIIGTNAPVFWPRQLAGTYTASSGVVLNGVTTFPIRSATVSQVVATNQGTAAHASTVGPPRVTTGPTAGVVGSSALTVKAESAPGTTNTSDLGVYTVSVTNW